jgi:hypothetical protein
LLTSFETDRRGVEINGPKKPKTTNLLFRGDNDTKYFQSLADDKRVTGKMRIFKLEQGQEMIEGDESLKNRSPTTYYKAGLFEFHGEFHYIKYVDVTE